MEKKELTAADIWAMFAETDKQIKEGFAEIRAIQEKTAKTIDRIGEKQEKNAELIGGIGNSNGAFAENLFFHSLEKSKMFAGVHFDVISNKFGGTLKMPGGKKLEDQFDIVMINDDSVAIIEVKYSSESEYAKKMVEKKIPNFKTLFPKYADYKIYLGMGALSFDAYTVRKAEEYGVGLLNISGDTVEYKTDWVRAY